MPNGIMALYCSHGHNCDRVTITLLFGHAKTQKLLGKIKSLFSKIRRLRRNFWRPRSKIKRLFSKKKTALFFGVSFDLHYLCRRNVSNIKDLWK